MWCVTLLKSSAFRHSCQFNNLKACQEPNFKVLTLKSMFLLTKSKRHFLRQLLGIEANDSTGCKNLTCYLTYSSRFHFFFHKSPHPWAGIYITACASIQVPGCHLTLHTSEQRLLTLQRQNTDHKQQKTGTRRRKKLSVLLLSLPQSLCTCLGSGRGHRASIPTTGTASVQSQACQDAAQATLTLTASDPAREGQTCNSPWQ